MSFTPIEDIIATADEIEGLALRISSGLDHTSKFYDPYDAVQAYNDLRAKTEAIFQLDYANALMTFILGVEKTTREMEETKTLTPAELGCTYPI